MPTYLAEIQRQRGDANPYPAPRTYVERNIFASFPDEALPLIVVISAGVIDTPVREGDGTISAWWSLGVGIVAAANTEANSERMAKIYGAAVRAILVQKPGLDGAWEYSGIELFDENYEDVPDVEQERTMRSAQLVFQVLVTNITSKFAGPAYPVEPDPGQPGSAWPTVKTADVTVVKEA